MASWHCPDCGYTVNAAAKPSNGERHCSDCVLSRPKKKRSRKAVVKRKKKHARPRSTKK